MIGELSKYFKKAADAGDVYSGCDPLALSLSRSVHCADERRVATDVCLSVCLASLLTDADGRGR